MSIATEPSNKNFLSPLGFKFGVKKLPNVNWFVQAVNLPGLSLPDTSVAAPFVNIPISGDRIQFEYLEVTFRVDEDMENYLELYRWFIGTGFPNNFEQYAGIDQTSQTNRFTNMEAIRSDASLIILNSKMKPKVEIAFRDVRPVSISELKFDTRMADVTYIDATATFRYLDYTITSL